MNNSPNVCPDPIKIAIKKEKKTCLTLINIINYKINMSLTKLPVG